MADEKTLKIASKLPRIPDKRVGEIMKEFSGLTGPVLTGPVLTEPVLTEPVLTEPKFKFFNFPADIKREGTDYTKVVKDNFEGLSMLGKKKLIDFFLGQPVAYRKIVSFILLKQKLADKHVKIPLDKISSFCGLNEEDTKHALYFLYRTVQLLKGDKQNFQEYRIPGYLYLNDILKVIKKKQDSLERKQASLEQASLEQASLERNTSVIDSIEEDELVKRAEAIMDKYVEGEGTTIEELEKELIKDESP